MNAMNIFGIFFDLFNLHLLCVIGWVLSIIFPRILSNTSLSLPLYSHGHYPGLSFFYLPGPHPFQPGPLSSFTNLGFPNMLQMWRPAASSWHQESLCQQRMPHYIWNRYPFLPPDTMQETHEHMATIFLWPSY